MKKARHVSIDLNDVLSQQRCDELTAHAVNSGTYYVERFGYTPGAVREKLLTKGYPDDTVMVALESPQDAVDHVNLIERAMKQLTDDGVFADTESNARRLAQSCCESGRSAHSLRDMMYTKRYDKALIDDVLDTYDERLALDNAVKSVWSSFKKNDTAEQRWEKSVQRLVGRGFRYNDVESSLTDFIDEQQSEEEIEQYSKAYIQDLWG